MRGWAEGSQEEVLCGRREPRGRPGGDAPGLSWKRFPDPAREAMPGWFRQCPPVPHSARSNYNSGFLKLQVRQGWAPIPAEIQREALAAARA